MKMLRNIICAAFALASAKAEAQITITSNDLPNVNDAVPISVATTLANFQPDSTGPNYIWDYRFLIPDSQRVVNCVSASTTPYTLYNFLANYGIYNYTPDQFPFSLLGTPPTNVYDFYKKTNTFLAIVGQGITIAGTGAIPAIYSNADRVYKLPLHYGDADTSVSDFGAPVPNFGYYRKQQTRINEVDGWGTLMTPFGTFSTLRIKSTLQITDSIYLDTLGFGITIPRQAIVEYKWLGLGKKIPLLEVDVTNAILGNGFTVNRVNWQDTLLAPLQISFMTQNTCPIVNEGMAMGMVSGGKAPVKYQWSTGDTTDTIMNLAPGIYTLTVTDSYGGHVQAVDTIQTLADSSCLILADFTETRTCPQFKEGALTATVTGARLPAHYQWSTGDTTLTISNLGVGTYSLVITDKFNRKDTAYGVVHELIGDAKCLNIPNAFTPDGDGTNDTWNLRSLSQFENCKVEIFNQWGSLMFRSNGYKTPWDGKYNGEPAPAGAYYFVIDLGNGENKYTGTVTIIR